MDVRFGVHAGLQHTSIAELRELWARIEALGFDWISIWDHFYAADATGDPHCLEAITSHTALACRRPSVSRAARSCTPPATATPRCSPTRWRRSTRSPTAASCSASAAAGCRTSTTRTACTTASPGERLRMLDEYVQCVRGLLTQERTTFDGEFFTLHDAQCEPKPVQARLPIWIGGGGEKVTLRIAARVRRRLERAVHPARRVGAQGAACSTSTARRSAAIRPRSRRRSTSAWRSPTRS